MIKIQIDPRSVSFYDELTHVHLTLSKPRAEVPEDADLTNIKRGVKVGTIILIEGDLDGETKEAPPADENTKDKNKEPKKTADEEPEETTEEISEESAEEEVEDETPAEKDKYTKAELEDLYVKDLKEIAKDKDITGYSSMVKDDLIEAILKEQEA